MPRACRLFRFFCLSLAGPSGERRLAAENADLVAAAKRGVIAAENAEERGSCRRTNNPPFKFKIIFFVNGVSFARRVLLPRFPRFPRLTTARFRSSIPRFPRQLLGSIPRWPRQSTLRRSALDMPRDEQQPRAHGQEEKPVDETDPHRWPEPAGGRHGDGHIDRHRHERDPRQL